MGMVIPTIFLTVTYKLPITVENTAVFYRGNITDKSPGKIPVTGIRTHAPTCQKVTRLPNELLTREIDKIYLVYIYIEKREEKKRST